MNENGTNINANAEVTANTAETDTLNQPEQELTAEEKLAERERLIDERERAIELKERTMNVVRLLNEKGLPSEFAEILRIDSDEKNLETIDKLAQLWRGKVFARIDTGFDHGETPHSNVSDFIRGLRN